MKRLRTQMRLRNSHARNTKQPLRPLEYGGYLGMPGISLSIFREKKIGTSVNTTTIYSSSLSPPPIRPMVENYPYFEIPVLKDGIQNPIEECT